MVCAEHVYDLYDQGKGMKLIKNVGFMLAFLPAAQALGRWHH